MPCSDFDPSLIFVSKMRINIKCSFAVAVGKRTSLQLLGNNWPGRKVYSTKSRKKNSV